MRLPLHHDRATHDNSALVYVMYAERHQVAAAKLAVQRKIEECEVANAFCQLQPNTQGPDFLRLERGLWAKQSALVPRCSIFAPSLTAASGHSGPARHLLIGFTANAVWQANVVPLSRSVQTRWHHWRMSKNAYVVRTVDKFEEPLFTELVTQLLHDPERQSVAERFFGARRTTPPESGARQVRVGAFASERLVGWSHGWLQPGGTFYVSNSAVVPEFRRQGVYSSLTAAMENEANALGCVRIESHHRAANNPVLIAKMKAGYTIVGTEYTLEMGLLIKMCKQLDERRERVFQARAGIIEGTVRKFGSVAPS